MWYLFLGVLNNTIYHNILLALSYQQMQSVFCSIYGIDFSDKSEAKQKRI